MENSTTVTRSICMATDPVCVATASLATASLTLLS